jgi:hypothetical protein
MGGIVGIALGIAIGNGVRSYSVESLSCPGLDHTWIHHVYD